MWLTRESLAKSKSKQFSVFLVFGKIINKAKHVVTNFAENSPNDGDDGGDGGTTYIKMSDKNKKKIGTKRLVFYASMLPVPVLAVATTPYRQHVALQRYTANGAEWEYIPLVHLLLS